MKSLVFVLAILRVGSAAAQLDEGRTKPIEMISPEEVDLGRKSDSSKNPERIYESSAIISVSNLAIPVRARKEFDKANELIRKQDWSRALQKLRAAISTYPPFWGAYNNLGVVYAFLGDSGREREALQKAIELNDNFALAYLNWGRMNIENRDFSAADVAFGKASRLDSTNPTALLLLAYSKLMQGQLQEAIATSQKAHALRGSHAFAHRVAARAFEQQRKFDQAVAELLLFLEEDNRDPEADSARKELEVVQATIR